MKPRPTDEPPSLPTLPAAARVRPPCSCSADPLERLRHSAGKSTADLLRLRAGRVEAAPDAVAYPQTPEEVGEVLRWAEREKCALVPFGGGTSVVGGVAPLCGEHRAVVTVDMKRLCRVLETDPTSGLARAESGILGPDLERELARIGLSLGHFPQSFEFSTLGGWIATRSAGQNSTLYGKIEDLVRAVRLIAPTGELVTRTLPATATGPELKELMVGSEGVLGVILEATVRVHRKPARTRFASFLLDRFAAGVETVRTILQDGLHPAIVRLSDEEETELGRKMSVPSFARDWGAKILGWMGKGALLRGVHLLVGFEGVEELLGKELEHVRGIVRRLGGISIGAGPGIRWERERFRHPYLRDELLGRGVAVDTLETAAPWSLLLPLVSAVRACLARAPLVLCHLSHAYPDGASLYFTFFFDGRDPDGALTEWERMKRKASDAIVAGGGTISHHHAVGVDHRAWLERERGQGQVALLRSLKKVLDPAGIMNPGKLVP